MLDVPRTDTGPHLGSHSTAMLDTRHSSSLVKLLCPLEPLWTPRRGLCRQGELSGNGVHLCYSPSIPWKKGFNNEFASDQCSHTAGKVYDEPSKLALPSETLILARG